MRADDFVVPLMQPATDVVMLMLMDRLILACWLD